MILILAFLFNFLLLSIRCCAFLANLSYIFLLYFNIIFNIL